MRHRVLHGDGATTSELILGTWGLSGSGYGPVDAGALVETIERAVDAGITLIDGAPHYAEGQLFRQLRDPLARFPQLGLMARVGVEWHDGRLVKSLRAERITAAVDAIIMASGRARLDVCMLHAPTVDDFRGGAVDALREGIRRGVVRTWGASVTGVSEAHAAIDAGALTIAIPFHAFHQPIYRSIAARARGRGVRVLAHSVLAYGLLAGRWAPDHRFGDDDHRAERWASHEFAARLEHLEVLRRLVRGDVHGLRSAALRYVLQQDAISAAIIGPRSPAQLDELVRDVAHIDGSALPVEDVLAFEALSKARGLMDTA
jgi:aryl-alcohol dehydrogenase-like predicted oxidoreductase